jgi:hypothetical protein
MILELPLIIHRFKEWLKRKDDFKWEFQSVGTHRQGGANGEPMIN